VSEATRIRRTRYGIAALLAAGAVLLAAPALGGSGIPFFGDGGDAPSVEPGQLRSAVSLRMPDGAVAALWVAPTSEGGRCVVLNVGPDGSAAAPSRVANSGGWCARPPLSRQRAPIATTINWVNPAGGLFEVVLAGQVSRASGIARVELRSAARATPLPLAQGLFVGALPSSGAAGQLARSGGPYVLVGRDRAGAEVATLDLAELLAAARP
jgi:hypothetical protein